MPKVNILENLVNRVWASCRSDAGKGLIVLGTFGWVFSALAQIGMIARNKDIDKKEKKFLIPQEISDGVINCTLYYTVCAAIKKAGDSLLENCFFITQKTHDALMKLQTSQPNSLGEIVKGELLAFSQDKKIKLIMKETKGNLSKFWQGSIKYLNLKLENCPNLKFHKRFANFKTPQQIQEQIQILKDAQRNFKKYKNGVGVLTAVSASVLASNLLTPIARNITANYFQKKLMKDKYKTKQIETTTPVPYRLPVSNTFNKFKI